MIEMICAIRARWRGSDGCNAGPGKASSIYRVIASGLVERKVAVYEHRNTLERMQGEIFDGHVRRKRIDLDVLISQAFLGQRDTGYPHIDAIAKTVKNADI